MDADDQLVEAVESSANCSSLPNDDDDDVGMPMRDGHSQIDSLSMDRSGATEALKTRMNDRNETDQCLQFVDMTEWLWGW